jgi:WD40 repeat protein
MIPNPYVGPRAFAYGETLYGRDQELKDLSNLLIARRIVLLYSPSGAGKTSLIQAALIDKLRKGEGFRVLPVMRPGLEPPPDASVGANRYLLSVLMFLKEGLPKEKSTPLPDLAKLSLAEFLERNGPEPGESVHEVLIFDQFEEILTRDPTDEGAKKEFFQQVGEALQPKNRWALFAMREEYVAGLDPYLLDIPTRLKTTFRLDLLSLEAARQAIQEPARRVGGEFTDAAAEQLVKDLSTVYVPGKNGTPKPRVGLSVEPVQLQVVCQRLWKRYGENDLKIGEDELRDMGDVSTALADYYAEQLTAMAQGQKALERDIREWVQTNLLTEHGLRGQVQKEPRVTKGLDNQVLQVLLDAHLVREDTKGARTYYELSHDRLIEPVRENNEAWFQTNLNNLQHQAKLWQNQNRPDGLLLTGQALAQAEQWAAANEALLQKHEQDFLAECRAARAQLEGERRSARRIKNYLRVVAGLAILAIVLAILALFQTRRAKQEAQLATANRWSSSAFANLSRDPERSLLLALEAVKEVNAVKEEKLVSEGIRAKAERVMQVAENALYRAMFTSRVVRNEKDQVRPDPYDEGSLAKSAYHHKVAQVCFRSDGKGFAIVGLDGSVKIWDTATKEFLQPPQKVEVNWAAFSPDGSRLAMACKDATAKIWEVGKKELIPLEHKKEVLRVYFNKPGTYLATACSDDTVRLWNAATLAPLWTEPFRRGDLTDLAFSPDGESVATAHWDGQIFIQEVRSRTIKKEFSLERSLKRVYFSPDGTLLATVSSDDGMVKVWKISSSEKPFWEGKDFGLEAAFSPDGNLLALANKYDHVVYVLDTATGTYKAKLPGHTDAISQLFFLPPGDAPQVRFLVSASEDETVRMWDLTGSKELFSLAGHLSPVKGVALSPDPEKKGNRLVSVGGDGQGRVWDIGVGHTASVNRIIFNQTGDRLATASNDGTARMWDAKDGHELFQLGGDQDRISAMTFFRPNPDKEELVTAGNGETLKFCTDGKQGPRLMDGNAILRRVPKGDPTAKIVKINDITFSPQGKYAVVQAMVGFEQGRRAKILLFNPGQEVGSEPPKMFPPIDMDFHCLAISRSEDQLALGLTDGSIQVWDLNTGKPVEVKGRHQDAVLSLAYSPKEDYLASASADRKVKLWKWNPQANSWEEVTKQEKEIFPAFDGPVSSVAFSHDGKLLAAGSKDRTAKVFNLEGKKIHDFSHFASINEVAFSPDNHKLATACDDNRWYIYQLTLKDAIDQAQKKNLRELTQKECQMFDIIKGRTPGACVSPKPRGTEDRR